MKTFLITTLTAAMALSSLAAQAQYLETCSRSKSGHSCSLIDTRQGIGGSMAKIIQIPQPLLTEDEITEAQARDDHWVATCKPIPVIDKYGVTRMTYDAACPHGVITGTGTRPK